METNSHKELGHAMQRSNGPHSASDEETLFIPFDNIAPSLPAFEAREISWTLWKVCTAGGDQEYNFKEMEHVRTRLTNASDVVVT